MMIKQRTHLGLLVNLLLLTASALTVHAQTDLSMREAPYFTRGTANQFNAVPQDKIIIACPGTIQVAPVYVPAGWQSLGSLARQRVSIVIDKKQRSVVCWYGIMGGDQN